MLNRFSWIAGIMVGGLVAMTSGSNVSADESAATREFEIRGDRAWLGGQQVELWGLRCGNALYSEAVTERHVRNLDNMAAHGINLLGVVRPGQQRRLAGRRTRAERVHRDGKLQARRRPAPREAGARGRPAGHGRHGRPVHARKDQELLRRGGDSPRGRGGGRLLGERQLKKRLRRRLSTSTTTPSGSIRPASASPTERRRRPSSPRWFKAVAPDIEVGVCPDANSATADTYPGMDVRIIQK